VPNTGARTLSSTLRAKGVSIVRFVGALLVLLACGAASAAIDTGFESYEGYTGLPGGSALTYGFGNGGQMGWYNPVAGSADAMVYTYAGNALGLPQNPTGEEQFVGELTLPNAAYGRAQHGEAFAMRKYTMSYDICGAFLGDLPSAQYLGSVSLQNSATDRYFIALSKWDDETTCVSWSALFNVFDAAGAALNEQAAAPGFTGLSLYQWYRESITFDLVTNMIVSVSIRNLTTGGATTKASPTGWYLAGGEESMLPLPTGYRLFSGGNTASGGNTLGYDNLVIVPEPGLIGLVVLGGLGVLGLRRRK
jgi:hypothetical protein